MHAARDLNIHVATMNFIPQCICSSKYRSQEWILFASDSKILTVLDIAYTRKYSQYWTTPENAHMCSVVFSGVVSTIHAVL